MKVLLLALGSLGVAAGATSYPSYLGGPAHHSYASNATTITTTNAASATSVWNWSPVAKGGLNTYLNATPVENNGIIYIGSETGDMYAVTAATGTTKWRKKLSISNCSSSGIVSSADVAKDPVTGKLTVYVGAADHYLYALNAASGATIWKTLIGQNTSAYYNWSSPTISHGHIYYGVGTSCGNAGLDGEVALDQHTGAVTGRYFTSGSSTVNGATVYTAAAVAPDGSVFVTTGDDNGASDNDAVAIVKLAGSTLARLAAFQVPNVAGQNLDFNASPTLWGTMVGACDKNGKFYARNQSDLSAAWTDTLGIPPAQGSLAFCGGSAAYDGSHLFVGADAPTAGAPPGSIYELDPTTGAVLWETALSSGPVVGSPSLDGAGVLAVPTYNSGGNSGAVYLVKASDGSILRTINYPNGPIFAQPVFADGELLVAGPSLQAYVPR